MCFCALLEPFDEPFQVASFFWRVQDIPNIHREDANLAVLFLISSYSEDKERFYILAKEPSSHTDDDDLRCPSSP